jgi:hypothetical protein
MPASTRFPSDTIIAIVSGAGRAAIAVLRVDELARDPAELGEDEVPATANVEGLRRFLEGEVLRWFEPAGRNWPTGR